MIICTDVDLVKLAQEAYRLSVPQGYGFMHFTTNPLSEDMARQLIHEDGYSALEMDYVDGRACKLGVLRHEDGSLTMKDTWYDHTDQQYKELLESVGLEVPEAQEHGPSCECSQTQRAFKLSLKSASPDLIY